MYFYDLAMTKAAYILTTKQLGFRIWHTHDLDSLAAINADDHVMRYFPSIIDRKESESFMQRMNRQYEARGHCYFATDELSTGDLIGFIGLSFQDYPSPFTPFIDIGWRLGHRFWGKGYATEGAAACLEFGFSLGQSEIFAVAPQANNLSIRVMQRIGMQYFGEFNHPGLHEHPLLEHCLVYRMSQNS